MSSTYFTDEVIEAHRDKIYLNLHSMCGFKQHALPFSCILGPKRPYSLVVSTKWIDLKVLV